MMPVDVPGFGLATSVSRRSEDDGGSPGSPVSNPIVAHAVHRRRRGAHAAVQLRDAIDKALLIGTPVQNPEGKAN